MVFLLQLRKEETGRLFLSTAVVTKIWTSALCTGYALVDYDDALIKEFSNRCHPGPGPAKSVGVGSSLAVQSIEVEYFGHT